MEQITEKQLRFIYDLAIKLGLTRSQLYRICGGVSPSQLSKKEASQTIELLLALYEKRKKEESKQSSL